MIQEQMTLARWLFNPFIRVAGTKSLVGGLVAIGAGGLAAAAAGIRFDGLLDMHFVRSVPMIARCAPIPHDEAACLSFGRKFRTDEPTHVRRGTAANTNRNNPGPTDC